MKKVLISIGVLASVAILVYGCQKTVKQPEYKVTATVGGQTTGNEQAPEQTTCPVSGAPIKKNIWTWYNGKKVYFCCEACKKQFEENPEKYIKNLPQFKQ
jgi:YHS domain-containing protein